MNLLSWNCRGLGTPRIVRDLCQLVRENKPKLVLLMETKMSNKKIAFLKIKTGFENIFAVDSMGRSGGLALLWRDDILVEIQNYSRRHINAIISQDNNGPKWKFTGFYRHPNTTKHTEAWFLLRHLSHLQPNPWLCMGDFNEIVSLFEKRGVAARARGQMLAFQNALEDYELSDLGFRGPNSRGIMGIMEISMFKNGLTRQ